MNFNLRHLLISLVIGFVLVQITYADQPLPTPVGRVIWIKGSLKAVMPNKEERILQKKSILYLHDTLVTDAKSQAEIGFTDQTLMTFRENTRFYIDKYKYGQKSGKGESVMNLIKGGFRTITGAIAKNSPDNYAVNTPVATIGVRGTEYQVYVDNGILYTGFYKGSPCVRRQKNCPNKTALSDLNGNNSKTSANKMPSKSLCLSKQIPYARVKGPCGIPEPLTTKPSVFDQELTMVSEFIEPFSGPDGMSGGGNASGEGVVNTFCIR